MKSNPCLRCQFKDQDKNNKMCTHCIQRLEYVSHLERELNFAMTNAETKPVKPRLPTYSNRAQIFGAVSKRF
ncbi:MAG: hypothetical protein PVI38_13835 [Desulfobacterales bacterium]|jgi:hypothetical protein